MLLIVSLAVKSWPDTGSGGALIPVDCLHHALDGAVEEALGVLGVEILDQLGRADDIREEDGDLLPLAGQSVKAGQNLLGKMAPQIRGIIAAGDGWSVVRFVPDQLNAPRR